LCRRPTSLSDSLKEDVPLRHRLAVNEFLLKALQLEADTLQDVQLFKHLHEQYWNGHPLKVQLPATTILSD
jgi:hypothetical protein